MTVAAQITCCSMAYGENAGTEIAAQIDGSGAVRAQHSVMFWPRVAGDGFLATFSGPARAIRCLRYP